MNLSVLDADLAVGFARVVDEPRAVAANVGVDHDIRGHLEEHGVMLFARRTHGIAPLELRRCPHSIRELPYSSPVTAREQALRYLLFKETMMAESSKSAPSEGAAANTAKPAPPQDLPAKDVEATDADRVKGGAAGVKKTMSTQV